MDFTQPYWICRGGGNVVIERDGGLKINVIKSDVDDKYERLVLKFLKRFSNDGVFDTERLKRRVRKDIGLYHAIRSWFNEILIYDRKDVVEKFVKNRGKRVFGYISLLLFVIVTFLTLLLLPKLDVFPKALQIILLTFTTFLQSLLCYMTSTQMAMIKKYAPEDVLIWKDWMEQLWV